MRSRARTVALAALATCALALGCGGDDDRDPGLCGTGGCAPDCQALSGGDCDILEPSCRRRILDAVICVRGTPGEMPEIRTLTVEEYRAELLGTGYADAGALSPGADDDAGADVEDGGAQASSGEPDFWSAGLWLLGLLGPDEDLESASIAASVTGVAGYYNGQTGAITLIDRGQPEDSPNAQSLLAHELVHALQDQEIGLSELGERTSGSTDSWHARSCLIEGDATLYEKLAFALLHGFSIDPGRWDTDLRNHLKFARRGVVTARSPYTKLWHLHYPVGARYLVDAWLDRGNLGVQGLYWGPPTSTIHWMHGYRQSLDRREQLVLALACNDAAAPEGFERRHVASMGPFAVFAFLAHALREDGIYASEASWQRALQWRQDKLSVFGDAHDRVAVSWRIRFADAEAAAALAAALDAHPAFDLRAHARGQELELLASEDLAVLEHWPGTDPLACPPPTEP